MKVFARGLGVCFGVGNEKRGFTCRKFCGIIGGGSVDSRDCAFLSPLFQLLLQPKHNLGMEEKQNASTVIILTF